jgi:RHS repeat-associated protein
MKHEGGTDVYFDDLKIEITDKPVAMVVQENHYYPFGLGMKGLDWTLNPSKENKWQYNGGVEKNTDFDLNWYETKYRSLCIQANRFLQVDPKSEAGGQESLTTYQYAFNNPIRYNDPEGDLANDGENPLAKLKDYVVNKTINFVKQATITLGNYVVNKAKETVGKTSFYAKAEAKATTGARVATGVKNARVDINGGSVNLVSVGVERKDGKTTTEVHYLNEGENKENKFTAGAKVGLGKGEVGIGYERTFIGGSFRNKTEDKIEGAGSVGIPALGVEVSHEQTKSGETKNNSTRITLSTGYSLGVVNVVQVDLKIGVQYSRDGKND